MDLQFAFKQIDINMKTLVELEKIFGDASLKTWLQSGLGYIICKCLSEVIEGVYSEGTDEIEKLIAKYFKILNAIIPPLPNFGKEDFEYNSRSFVSCQTQDSNLIDELITQIMKPVFVLLETQLNDMFSEVFLKITFHV